MIDQATRIDNRDVPRHWRYSALADTEWNDADEASCWDQISPGHYHGSMKDTDANRDSVTDHTVEIPTGIGLSLINEVLILAWPALAQQGLLLLIQLYDQFLTGQFSPAHPAALTTANYLYWFTTSYAVVVTAGATALVARMIGANNPSEASRAAGQAILLALTFGLLGTLAAMVGLPTMVGWLGLEGDVAAFAVTYLRPLAGLLPFYMVETAGIACLVGAGDTRTGLKVLAVVVLVNVPLAGGLSQGLGGLPNLGFVGIAWGTGLSHLVGMGLVLLTLSRGRFGLQLRWAWLLPESALIRRLLRISIPAAVDSLSVGLFQFVFLRMVNDLGSTAASAHGIAIRLEGLGYLSGAAFAVAAASLVGRSLGAGRPDLAAKSGWIALLLGTGIMTLMGLIFFLLARPMFELFCPLPSQVPVIETGVPVLRLVAFAMPGLAACIILTQALRGAGDTRMPVVFTWIGFVGVRLPLTYVLTSPAVGLGLYGAWLAMFADIYIRGALFAYRFAGGHWKFIRV